MQEPDTDTVVVTGGEYSLTSVSRYGEEGWIEDFSSGLNTGRWAHGCSSFLSRDNERVKFLFEVNKENTLNPLCRFFWSPEAGSQTMSPLPRLKCIAPLLESGERSLVVLCQGLWLMFVW